MTLPSFSFVAQRLRSTGGIALLCVLSAAACVKTLPPAATPEQVAPPVDTSTPPGEGQGRLVVDVVEGPTQIQRVEMIPAELRDREGRSTFRFSESPELLCAASPCVADLPAGNVLLGFPVLGKNDALEVELVHIDPQTSVYRRSLSVYNDSSGAVYVLGIIGTSVGGSAAATGAVLLPIGLSDGNRNLSMAGAITAGAGAVLTAIGIWAMKLDAPTYRPGSSVHFSLSPSPPGAQ